MRTFIIQTRARRGLQVFREPGFWIALTALIGWGAITALAWYMANARIELCHVGFPDMKCAIAATAARDNLLIHGLTVGLIILVLAAATLRWKLARTTPSVVEAREVDEPRGPSPRNWSLPALLLSSPLSVHRSAWKLPLLIAGVTLALAAIAYSWASLYDPSSAQESGQSDADAADPFADLIPVVPPRSSAGDPDGDVIDGSNAILSPEADGDDPDAGPTPASAADATADDAGPVDE